MNTPEYKKAYIANLNLQIKNDKKNLEANKNQPATQQYIQNTGQTILGVSSFNNKTKGKKSK